MFPFGSKRISCRSATIHAAQLTLFISSNRSANKVEIKIKEIKRYTNIREMRVLDKSQFRTCKKENKTSTLQPLLFRE